MGIGDTDGDHHFLSAVARPICFNPSFDLVVHAKEKGWTRVYERKDVVLIFTRWRAREVGVGHYLGRG